MLTEWCLPWRSLQELKPSVLGHEIDVRFLNAISRDTLMVELTFAVSMNDAQKRFRMGLSHASLEGILRRMDQGSESPHLLPKPGPSDSTRWNAHLDDVAVTLTAACEGLELTARALANLKAGDTLTVEPQQFNEVQIRIGEHAKFVGLPGTSEGRWALHITRKLEA